MISHPKKDVCVVTDNMHPKDDKDRLYNLGFLLITSSFHPWFTSPFHLPSFIANKVARIPFSKVYQNPGLKA